MILTINRPSPAAADVSRLAATLRRGKPVVLPTETQYALACDATSQRAIAAVREIKGRTLQSPMSVFLLGTDDLRRWRIECPDYALSLARRFWPGPLTLVLPTKHPIFRLLGGDGTSVGIRVTPEPIIGLLLERLNVPLVATSANPSGMSLNARRENNWLRNGADGGQFIWVRPARFVRHPASTVLDCTGSAPRQIRAGAFAQSAWNAARKNRLKVSA